MRDVSTLSFKTGTIGPDKRNKENSYMSLLQRGLGLLGINYPSIDLDTVFIADTISDISGHLSVSTSNIIINDPDRGGIFTLYEGDQAPDNGMIFLDGAGQKWKRQINNGDPINVLWFGFIADGVTDNYPMWQDLMAYLIANKVFLYPYNHSIVCYAKLPDIIFPQQDNYYYFSQTLTIEYNMVISGQATYQQNWGAKLLFPVGVKGINITYPDEITPGLGTSGVTVKDLLLQANVAIEYDNTAHGIDFKQPVFFSNVGVINFGGNGFNGDVAPGGNVDGSVLDKCYASQNLNGFYFQGNDAQAMNINSCNAVANRAWGFLDRGFLGNTYTACHSASNGDAIGQKTFALNTILGTDYMYGALRDGILVEPGVAEDWEDDWQLIGPSIDYWTSHAAAYNPLTEYMTGGSYGIDFDHPLGENQHGVLVGCYSEGGQMPGYLGQRSLAIGGAMAAGWRNNATEIIASAGAIGTENSSIFAGQQSIAYYTALLQDRLRVLKGSQGIDILYNDTYKTVEFRENNSGASSTFLSQANTTAADFQRTTIVSGALINLGGLYSTAFDDGLKAKRIIYGATAPVAGSWNQGDIVFNSAPVALSPLGWRCILSGTPGTWETIIFPT